MNRIFKDADVDSLKVNGLSYPRNDGTVGQTLTSDGKGKVYFADSGGGGGTLAVVGIPLTGLVQSGSLWYPTYGPPFDLYGSESSSVTVSADVVGDRIICSKDVYRVYAEICSQYITQFGNKRTFIDLRVNNVSVISCADGVPTGNNNYRLAQNLEWYNVSAGNSIKAILNSNASGTVTFNSGVIFLSIPE